MHCASSVTPLEALLAYSSIASAFGNVGQANYAAGNASLDSLSTVRRTRGCAAVSVQWGAWAGGGMARSDARIEAAMVAGGWGLVGVREGVGALAW